MVVNFKARLFFDAAIRAANIRKEIKLRFGSGFKRCAHIDDMQRRDDRRDFAEALR